jgi:predicted DsbA family dithiol-disulfide isomerase
MMQHVRAAGAPFGITFADRTILSNSRLAIQAAEFARENGKFGEIHRALFSAYFSLGLDIGSEDIIVQIVQGAGLDAKVMMDQIKSGKYHAMLQEARQEAGVLGVTGVPAFFFKDQKSIVGAQQLDVFRKALRSL